jgi:tetratricopeptide (TPR) repeat protein
MHQSDSTVVGFRHVRALAFTAALALTVPALATDPTPPAAPPTPPAAAETPAAPVFTFTPDSALARLAENDTPDPAGPELEAIESIIKQASTAEPKNARWHYALALIERARRNAATEEAARRPHADAFFKHITDATNLDKKNPDYFFQLGEATMGTIKPSDGFMTMASVAGDAKDAWEQAIELDENHIGSHYALAQYEIQARKQGGMLFGSYKTARKHGEKLITLPKGKHLGHLALAAVAAAQEEWDEMTKQYNLAEQAAATDTQRGSAMYMHANSLVTDKKDAKAALPLIDRMVVQRPDNYSVYFLRASARKLAGDCAAAIDDFKQVLERNPEARNTRFMLAECYESTGDKAGALAMYEEFKAKFPSDNRAEQADKAIKRLKASKKS